MDKYVIRKVKIGLFGAMILIGFRLFHQIKHQNHQTYPLITDFNLEINSKNVEQHVQKLLSKSLGEIFWKNKGY